MLLTVLGVLFGILLVAVLLTLLVVLVSLRTLRRRNRVSIHQPTEAPLTWLASPVSAARLHRRLRAAVSVAQRIATSHGDRDPSSRFAAMAAELERQALAIDHQLTIVARLAPADRRRMLTQLGDDVREVERLVSRLSVLDAQSAAPAYLPQQPTAMQSLADELDHLEAARRELDQVEVDAGLGQPRMPSHDPATDPGGARRTAT